MKKVGRIGLTLLLCLILYVSLVPGTAAASDEWETFTLEDGTICITGYRVATTHLEIPSTIDGATVTQIGDRAFYDNDFLVSVTIPDTVTSIGSSAFMMCSGLTSVTIPDSMTAIGRSAFNQCPNLKSIRIPGSVTWIGYSAFGGCAALSSVELNEGLVSMEQGAFAGCTSLTSICFPKSLTNAQASNAASGPFAGCTALSDISFAPGTTYISKDLLRGCPGITRIVIPNTVTEIGEYAFNACENLKSVTIPGSMRIIGNGAFMQCGSLGSITIPFGVTGIGREAFSQCTALKSVRIPGSVEWMDYSVFAGCTALTTVELCDGLNSIGQGAFSGCTGLTRVEIPNTVSLIRDNTFSQCVNLQSVMIPVTVTSIGSSAFDGCSALTDVYYTGTQGEWGNIRLSSRNEPLGAAAMHYSYIPPLTVVAIAPDRSAAKTGKTITWGASAKGGSGSLQYYFIVYKDGEKVKTRAYGTDKTFSYTPIEAGIYRVRVYVKDAAGVKVNKLSSGVTVTGAALVTITTQPANKTVAAGAKATFTVDASGTDLAYQWQYSKNGTTWTNKTGATSASYTVTAKASYNGMLYRCIVTKAGSSVTSGTAKLTVTVAKPVITTQPKAQTAAVGATATYKVVASGTGLTYQWQYSSDYGATWHNKTGATSASYTVTAKASYNGMLYRCRVKNSGGTVYTSKVRLTVSGVKPKILSQPKAQTAAAGGSVTFKVIAAGESMSYQWQYSTNGGTTWKNKTGATSSSYTVTAKASYNGILYRCRVKNSYGTVYSSGAALTVS